MRKSTFCRISLPITHWRVTLNIIGGNKIAFRIWHGTGGSKHTQHRK
ncbi:MAG TPA: hypothetical protein PK299_01580 [Anaerolineales bacterium]|nr:hypothetical protein [Anaerolineales bacterium]